jgi:hypothetical protein
MADYNFIFVSYELRRMTLSGLGSSLYKPQPPFV